MAVVEVGVKSRAGLDLRAISASRAVVAGVIAAAFVWALTADVRESMLLDKRQDLGHFTQAVWATAHGHILRVTEAGGTDVSRLGIHVDPIVVVFAPLWWLWPSPQLLLTVQAIALACGALPIFWLGRKHLARERDAAFVAGAYLLCPSVGWNAVSDFHAVALAVPLLLFAVWYLEEGRFLAFAVAACAAVLCQEQIGLLVGCLGLWHVWRTRRLRAGLIIASLGFAASVADLLILRHLSGGTPYSARFGGSPGQIAADLFTHPFRLLEQINAHDLSGLLLALPVLGACFGSSLLLAATPQIGLLLLSHRHGDWFWFGINAFILIPFIYSATVFAVARTQTGTRVTLRNAKTIFVASLVIGGVVGPIGILEFPGGVIPANSSLDAQREAIKLIPADVRVSATNHLALPLETRPYIYVFPIIRDANWAIVDSKDDMLPDMSYVDRRGVEVGVSDLYRQPELMARTLRLLERSRSWRLVYESKEIYVFRRQVTTG